MYFSKVMILVTKRNNNGKAENCTIEKGQDFYFFNFTAKREKWGNYFGKCVKVSTASGKLH